MDDDDFPEIPLINTIDLDILMHRDAHFGGNFDVMIDYYEQEGVGVLPEFEIARIKQLQLHEEELDGNLTEVMMPLPAKQSVERSKKLYHDLRSIYEVGGALDTIPHMISDLILTEAEDPVKEIDSLVKQGKSATKPLLDLITSDMFFDPLYPGYGRTPIFAARCLAKIQDESAIPFLFTALGQDNFFTDEELIKALFAFGDRAKAFLLKRLKAKPYSRDNEHAIIALGAWGNDEEIAEVALELLCDEESWKHIAFSQYLIFACAGLVEEGSKERLKGFSKEASLPKGLRDEIGMILKNLL